MTRALAPEVCIEDGLKVGGKLLLLGGVPL
jgi:hypothetical protein